MLFGAAPGWAHGRIAWHGCGPEQPANLQCGELSVPLDYNRPHGPQITLGFNRLRAADRAHRVGSLIINPGGPGGPGSFFVAIEAAGGHLWNPALHERFDMIGMDPRGVGLSTPIQCDPDVYNQLTSRLFPNTAAQFDQLASSARAFGQSCLERTGPLLGHVDTRSAARDMEALRRGLGDGKLNFLGLSYGAHLGSAYAELYPRRIRTMALDAIANHSVSVNALFADAAAAYEDALNRFAAWCAQTSSCPLHGRDVLALFDSVVQRADQQPIPAPDCADGSCRPTVTGGEIRLQALFQLVIKDGLPPIFPSWNDFAIALARADQGDASGLSPELASSPLEFAGLAINCGDYPPEIVTYQDFVAKTLLGRVVAPHTQGASEAWLGLLGCMRWPVPVTYLPHSITVRGAPPILLVSATHDPETNYRWAHELLRQMPSAVLLTRDGDGHTSSWLQNSQTSDAIAHYLITRQTPLPNTVYPD
jgi:pimeloyl-ACP methyl ester carboxylesterase